MNKAEAEFKLILDKTIENFGDYPFYKDKVPAYVIAYITAIALQIKRICSLPLGINVLRNDANAALSIADAIGADYIRVNIHSGAMLTDQGIIEGKAAHTIRLKKILKSNVKIWADVQVKHAAPLAISYDLLDIAKDTYYRGMADAIILSGKATGSSIEIKELKRLKNALPQIPIIIGSGVDTYNIAQILEIADAVIVGTSIKEDGITTNPVSVEKVRTLLERFER